MRSFGCLLAIIVALFALCNSAYLPSGPKIIGYWGCQPGSLPTTTSQLQTALNKGYNVIIFAFYLVDEKGAIFKDYGSVPAPTKSEIRQNGKDFSYLISLFGGENGSAKTMTMTPDAWARTMFNNFDALSKQYGFDGIDIDLENSWGGSGDAVACGLRLFFKYMHNAGYVVSMAPQTTAVTPEVPFYATGSWNSYVPLLDESVIDYVDIVAIQLYNNAVPFNSVPQYTTVLSEGFTVAGCPACDDGKTTRKVKVPASKLVHGHPSTIGAAPANCPGTAFTANGKCLYGNDLLNLYSNPILSKTGGVMTWAVEWDGKDAKWDFVTAAAKINFGTTIAPTSAPTTPPSKPVTVAPTVTPTITPTTAPKATVAPTTAPTTAPKPPTAAATVAPTVAPTTAPTTAPKPPTAAATVAPPVTQPISKCRISWTHSYDGSWKDACGDVTQYKVTMKADKPITNFQFSLTSAGVNVKQVWNVDNKGNGLFSIPSWVFGSSTTIPAGTEVTFGYFVQGTSPATATILQSDPCRT